MFDFYFRVLGFGCGRIKELRGDGWAGDWLCDGLGDRGLLIRFEKVGWWLGLLGEKC